MGSPFAEPLSITTSQGWPALSSYLKTVTGGGDVEDVRVGKEYLAFIFFP